MQETFSIWFYLNFSRNIIKYINIHKLFQCAVKSFSNTQSSRVIVDAPVDSETEPLEYPSTEYPSAEVKINVEEEFSTGADTDVL